MTGVARAPAGTGAPARPGRAGAGLQSVAVPALVVHLLQGSGRVNVGQGMVATCQGIGPALSPALGGRLAQHVGYAASFVVLGAVSTGSLAWWPGFGKTLREACCARAVVPDAAAAS
jgi:MFS family permease